MALMASASLTFACDDGGSDDGDDGMGPGGGDGGGGEGGNSDSTYYIGVVHPITGPVAQAGVGMERQLRAAQKVINDAGGVVGKKLDFVFKDSKSDPAEAGKAVKSLLDAGHKVINGAVVSSVTAGVLDVTVPAGALVINGASTSVGLTANRDNKGLFVRAGATVALESRVLADYAVETGVTNVKVLSADSDFTLSIAQEFSTAFNAQTCGGGACVSEIATFDPSLSPDEQDYEGEARKLISGNPDAILVTAYAINGANLLEAVASLGYSGRWFVADILMNNEATELLSPATIANFEGASVMGNNSGPAFESWADAVQATSGERPGATSTGSGTFDIVMLAALAAEKSGGWNPAAMSTAMRELSNPPGMKMHSGQFSAALDMVRQGQDIDWEGSSGPLDIDELGDVSAQRIRVWKVVNGDQQTVKVVDVGTEGAG